MIYVLLADGFEEIEAFAPIDILRRAGRKVQTVGITGMTVCGAHGIAVQADIAPAEATEPIDLLVLPGGMPGAANLDASPEVDRLLQAAMAQGAHIGAICAAPFILGKRNLLVGRAATCYPGFEEHLHGAHKLQQRVVTSDTFTTAVGMGAAFEFGLSLLVALGEEEKAKKIANDAFLPDPMPAQAPVITKELQIAVMRAGYRNGRLTSGILQRELSIYDSEAVHLLGSLDAMGFICSNIKERCYDMVMDEDAFEAWAATEDKE